MSKKIWAGLIGLLLATQVFGGSLSYTRSGVWGTGTSRPLTEAQFNLNFWELDQIRRTDAGSQVKGVWYVSTNSAIANHAATTSPQSLKSISNTIGTAQATIEAPPGAYAVTSALTIGDSTAKNVTYRPQRGAIISHGANTVTINGTIEAAPDQIVFVGTGPVYITGQQDRFINWFNGVGDGVTDDSVAVQQAINSSNGVRATVRGTGSYLLGQSVFLKNYITLDKIRFLLDRVPTNIETSSAITWGGLRIQSKTYVSILDCRFSGLSNIPGSYASDAIHIDSVWESDDALRGTGTKHLTISRCSFYNITEFGIKANMMGGYDWNISNNSFHLSGGASTVGSTGGGSNQGIQMGLELLYEDNVHSALTDNITIANNTFIIDCSAMDYHGIATKMQGLKHATITGNTVLIIGDDTYTVVNHGSPICRVYAVDSAITGNNWGGLHTNPSGIIDIQYHGCKNTIATGNRSQGNLLVANYKRGTYYAYIDNFMVDGHIFTEAPGSVYLGGGDDGNYSITTSLLVNVIVENMKGTVYNYTHYNSHDLTVRRSIVTRAYPTNAGNSGLLAYVDNDIYASTSDGNSVKLYHAEAIGNRFYGIAAGSEFNGDYIVKLIKSIVRANQYITPTISQYAGQYSGAISIDDYTDPVGVFESPTSFVNCRAPNWVVNQSSPHKDHYSTVDDNTPTVGTWRVGQRVWRNTTAPGGAEGLICTSSGTLGTLAGVTGNITTGTAILTVSSSTNLSVGDFVTIAGVSSRFKIRGISGTTITLDANADATVAGAAIAFSPPTFKTFGTIAP